MRSLFSDINYITHDCLPFHSKRDDSVSFKILRLVTRDKKKSEISLRPLSLQTIINQFGSTLSSITAREFSALLRSIAPRLYSKRIAIAVSGGPDSIALLYLLQQHFNRTSRNLEGKSVELLALTIDHKFRDSSSLEAENVKAFATSLGMVHETLEIPWNKSPFPLFPPYQFSEGPARVARLLLYHKKLREEGIGNLWMGHHLDDQVENRLLWGYGMQSIAKMDGEVLSSDNKSSIYIIRPLLNFSKSRLLATCIENKLPYFIDSTNLDPSYTPRNQLRYDINQYQARHSQHPHSLPLTSLDDTSGPLALLQRVSKSIAPGIESISSKLQSPAIRFQSPSLTTATILPRLHPSSISPTDTRIMLRNLIETISPGIGISQKALEATRKKVFLPIETQQEKNAFTPGGGVIFSPKSLGKGKMRWIVCKQLRRRGDTGRIELERDIWTLWDSRIWIRIKSSSIVDEKFFVEARGKYSEPVLISARDGVANQLLWQLPLNEKEKSWSNDSVSIDWKFYL